MRADASRNAAPVRCVPRQRARIYDMASGSLHRMTAFTQDPLGGNPAGVWIGDELPSSDAMLGVAAELGFSETAFLAPTSGRARTIRYFSPMAEVPFCGHATIAAGVLLGKSEGPGTYELASPVGTIPVAVTTSNGEVRAALTSVEPRHEPARAEVVAEALAALGWATADLDPTIPAAAAFAGNWHLVLAAATPRRLENLDYDFDRLQRLMLDEDFTTVQLVWRQAEHTFQSRNPFPVGGIVEDPATGAAAAALGGYLRDAGLLAAPATLAIHQGETMGRPSLLTVDIPAEGGIVVSGTAVDLPA